MEQGDAIKDFNELVERLTDRYFKEQLDFESAEKWKENRSSNIFSLPNQIGDENVRKPQEDATVEADLCVYAESPTLKPSPVARSCCHCLRSKNRIVPLHG